MKTYIFIGLNLLLVGFIIMAPTSVSATNCANVPTGGNYSIGTQACSFAGSVNGVDSGTGTTNTAILTIPTGGSLTILSGQTIATGSFSLTGGSITIIAGGSIRTGTPLYVSDADGDGYSTAPTTYHISPAAGRVRRNTLLSTSIVDCNEVGANANQVYISGTCYIDNDRDTYSVNSTVNCTNNATCASATWKSIGTGDASSNLAGGLRSYLSNPADCNDNDATKWILRQQCQTCCEQRLVENPCGCAPGPYTCKTYCWTVNCQNPAYKCRYCPVNFDCNCQWVCTT